MVTYGESSLAGAEHSLGCHGSQILKGDYAMVTQKSTISVSNFHYVRAGLDQFQFWCPSVKKVIWEKNFW